jgi:hypothetical protein
MLRAIRNRITAPTVIATVALVFAMTGGAYAAQKYLISSTKQISPKVLASLKGAAGKAGAPGAAGAAGPAGASGAGTPGPQGPAGGQGPAGVQGTQGEKGVAGAKGEKGLSGETGFTSTLPSGKTETGNWAQEIRWPEAESLPFQLSFNIPLATPSEHAVFLNAEETEGSEGSGKCELVGTGLSAKPVAPPGYLCVFTRLEEFGTVNFIGLSFLAIGDTPAGATIWATPTEDAANDYRVVMSGTWAVTAK